MAALSPAQQGTAIVSLINILPHRDDLIDARSDFGCCPTCCAPCSMLAELIDSGQLNDIVMLAPADLGVTRYDWWLPGVGFDASWADAWWRLYPCPNHTDE